MRTHVKEYNNIRLVHDDGGGNEERTVSLSTHQMYLNMSISSVRYGINGSAERLLFDFVFVSLVLLATW